MSERTRSIATMDNGVAIERVRIFEAFFKKNLSCWVCIIVKSERPVWKFGLTNFESRLRVLWVTLIEILFI